MNSFLMGVAATSKPGLKAFAALALVILTTSACGRGSFHSPPNLLLITIDTLRADRLGFTGHKNAKTPVLDHLAGKGAAFDCCIVSAPITLPSHCTMMTGLLPHEMEVRDNKPFSLSHKAETMAEILKKRGYQTLAVVSGETLAPGCGLEQGFDRYVFNPQKRTQDNLLMETKADQTTAQAITLLKGLHKDKPCFIWVHYFDPHHPYEPPSSFTDTVKDPYDGEVAFVDQQIGVLLEWIKQSGLWENTLLAAASDHGEGLGEHQEDTHAFFLYDTTIRTPLVFSGPGVKKRDALCSAQIRSMDLKDALLDLMGVEKTQLSSSGKNLAAYVRGETDAIKELPAFSESFYCYKSFNWAQMTTLRLKDLKLIQGAKSELFDLKKDPGENRPFTAPSEALGELKAHLQRIKKSAASRYAAGPPISLSLPGYFGGRADASSLFLGESENADLPHPHHKKESIKALLQAVALCGARTNLNQARGMLEDLAAEDPNNPTLRFWLGRTLAALGEAEGNPLLLQKSYEQFQKVLSLDPRNSDAFHLGVWRLIQLGAFEKAKQELDLWVQNKKENAKTWELYGFLHRFKQANGRSNPYYDEHKVLTYFDKSLGLNPNNLQLLQLLIKLCQDTGKKMLLEKYATRYTALKSKGWQGKNTEN